MQGKFLVSPLLTFDSTVPFCSLPIAASGWTCKTLVDVNLPIYRSTHYPSRNWKFNSTAQVQDTILSDEGDNQTWDSCRQALSGYNLAKEEQDKILGKAFGQIHSPYWGEERKKQEPRFEIVSEVLSYLKGLGLNDDDLAKLLKKFPESLDVALKMKLNQLCRFLKEIGVLKVRL